MGNINLKTNDNNNWLFAVIGLSTICIFSQLNAGFDIFITIAFLIAALVLGRNDDFILIYGVLYVFMSRLYIYQGGISLINVFLLIYVVRMLFKKEKIVLKGVSVLNFILLFIYTFVVMTAPKSGTVALLNYIVSILFLMSLVSKLSNIELLKKFCITISISSVAACIYGVFNKNSEIQTQTQQITTRVILDERFNGVSSDPNYMAMTLIIGILGLFMLDKRYKMVAIGLASVLVYFVFTTRSTTALVCLFVALAIYLIMQTKSSKILFVSGISIIVLIILILNWDQISLYLLKSETFGLFADRVRGQFNAIMQEKQRSIASGRLIIFEGYWNYFWKQNLFNIIFGGNLCGVYGIGDFVHTIFREKYVTHNTQLDILLGLGIFGWIMFSYVAIKSLIRTWIAYFKTNEIAYKLIFTLKVVLIIFTFSLSFFPGWTMLVFYFLDFEKFKIKNSDGGDTNKNLDNCR